MKTISRKFMALMLASAAVATLATPAMAQRNKQEEAAKPKPPKLSKPVAAALAAAQKMQAAGDNAGSLAKIAEAEAVPNPNEDDVYFIQAIKLNAAIALKDNAIIETTLGKMLATGRVSATDTPKFLQTIGSLALARKDYPTATNAFERLVAAKPGDGEALIGLAELYNAQKQTSMAVDTIGKAVAANKAAGVAVPENWYRRQLALAYDGKLGAVVQSAALALVGAYPTAVNWRDALVITRDSFKLDDQGSLDFMRLQAATGSLNGERDYVEYADTALGRGFPGEAKRALDEGIAKSMLEPGKPLVKELKTTADSKAAADRAGLPALEKEIKGNGRLALATGDAYYGFGDYAKAATLYKMAVGATAVDQPTANLRLGAALARAGDKAAAAEAFKAVKGGPRETLAQYWLAHIGA